MYPIIRNFYTNKVVDALPNFSTPLFHFLGRILFHDFHPSHILFCTRSFKSSQCWVSLVLWVCVFFFGLAFLLRLRFTSLLLDMLFFFFHHIFKRIFQALLNFFKKKIERISLYFYLCKNKSEYLKYFKI